MAARPRASMPTVSASCLAARALALSLCVGACGGEVDPFGFGGASPDPGQPAAIAGAEADADARAAGAKAASGSGASADSNAAPTADPEAELPAAEEIFARHVEAIGGAARIEALSGLRIESRISLSEQRLAGTVAFDWTPARFVLRQAIPGLGRQEVGHDGQRVWMRDDFHGLSRPTGAKAELYARGGSPFLVANWREHFVRIETRARVDFEGRPALEVEAHTPLGKSLRFFFDEGSGRLVGLEYEELVGAPGRRMLSVFEDYREHEGLWLAHRRRSRSSAGEIVQELVSVELDPEFAPGTFGSVFSDAVELDPAAREAPPIEAR